MAILSSTKTSISVTFSTLVILIQAAFASLTGRPGSHDGSFLVPGAAASSGNPASKAVPRSPLRKRRNWLFVGAVMVRLPSLRNQKTLPPRLAMGHRPRAKHLVEPLGKSDDGVRGSGVPGTGERR